MCRSVQPWPIYSLGFQEGRAELEQHRTLPGSPIALSFPLVINVIVQINKTVSVQSNSAEESPHKREPEGSEKDELPLK